jgi:hypothetical protein
MKPQQPPGRAGAKSVRRDLAWKMRVEYRRRQSERADLAPVLRSGVFVSLVTDRFTLPAAASIVAVVLSPTGNRVME